MNVCLIGKNLTNLVLANNLAKKNLCIDIVFLNKKVKNSSNRTLAISKNNFDFLLKIDKKINFYAWPINNIKIYSNKNNSKELFKFKSEKKENFFLLKYNKIFNYFENKCKKNKNIIFKNLNNQIKIQNIFEKNNYNLVIFSDSNYMYKKKYLTKRIEKNYNSIAYSAIINHETKKNNDAIQIFTKYGPLAFLPVSKNKTSIVFSILKSSKINEFKIFNLIKKYNFNYKIKKISKIEKFDLKFFILRNYVFKNILFFGDLAHKIHPLAGQGFNMTIRDIKILSSLIDEKIDLGLDLDKSLLRDFQSKTKHLHYIFGAGIDFIYNFFNIDNKTNNLLSESLFNIFKKNKFLNKYATLIADKGINI